MKTSMTGNKIISTLSAKAQTLYEVNQGENEYTFAQPYDTIKDEFVAISKSADTTDDEKAIANLGLLINDSWCPGMSLHRADILNAHRGILKTVEKEYEHPSESKIGSVLADATLNALDLTVKLGSSGSPLFSETISAVFLGDGFEAIMDSNATKKEKRLARKGIKATGDDVYKGEVPFRVMHKIAGKDN